MNIFFWKKNQVIDEFAFQLANELYNKIPPDSVMQSDNSTNSKARGKKDKLLANFAYELNKTAQKIADYQVTHSLGIYGKARLSFTFTERMKELGYSESIANEFSRTILLCVAQYKVRQNKTAP